MIPAISNSHQFPSTPSGGKATVLEALAEATWIGFNPRLPGERRRAPRAAGRLARDCFNPRLPGERRHRNRADHAVRREFQSTPSGGKATILATDGVMLVTKFQSTPSGGKATGASLRCFEETSGVSIHAFRGKGDLLRPIDVVRCTGFNPRLPGERRLWVPLQFSSSQAVSIHAFRGKGDRMRMRRMLRRMRFNPRLPGERRPSAWSAETCAHVFQSTPSGGKATSARTAYLAGTGVSIHAFRGKGDASARATRPFRRGFQSTPSGGKATHTVHRTYRASTFQSTPSGGKATRQVAEIQPRARVSIHAFRGKGDARLDAPERNLGSFNPRLPGERRPRSAGKAASR